MIRLTTICASFVFLIMMYSCSTDVVFEQLETVDIEGWNYKKPVKFSFNAPDTTVLHNLIFDIRITPDYAYQNIWLFIEITDPDGSVHIDSIDCPLAYPDGRWIGSGLGDLIDNPILVQQNFKFSQIGDYHFKIKHGMRNDNLPNVKNVGVILKRVKS